MILKIAYVLAFAAVVIENAMIKEKDISQLLRPYVARKCLKNADDVAFAEFQHAEKDFQTCLLTTPFPKSPDDIYNFMCKIIPQISYDCSKVLLQKLKPCLDVKEKYLPKFFLSVFNSSIEKRCEGGEEAFKEQLEDLKGVECGEMDSLSLVLGVADNCARNLIVENYSPDMDFVINKPFLCSKLESLKVCTMNHLEKLCEDDNFLKIVASDLGIVLRWCALNMEESDEEESEED